MKMALIGGAGVRTPLVVAAALRRGQRLGLDELCLMDTDVEKLHIIGTLSQNLARDIESPVRLTFTGDVSAALDGASYMITSIRVGHEQGRILDEKIALDLGILGQETTGPGGFAMAMRSIPGIVHYAQRLRELNPSAWIINFTNPAGLVAQALHALGYDRVIGICDSANGAQHAVAAYLGIAPVRLCAEVFGLNHLSFARAVRLDGQDLLQGLLNERPFQQATLLRLFDPELIAMIGLWLNEYLYYYYYAEKALAAIRSRSQTRGEEVWQWNAALMQNLRAIDVDHNPQGAREAYNQYMQQRVNSYMNQGRGDTEPRAGDQSATYTVEEDEGYAGVALDLIQALESGETLYTAVNVPNRGAINGLLPDDVVEVSCRVDSAGVHTLPIGDMTPMAARIVHAVKEYERLAVRAILSRSRGLAVQALMAHPLVLSYSRASALVDAYLRAHAAYVGDWS